VGSGEGKKGYAVSLDAVVVDLDSSDCDHHTLEILVELLNSVLAVLRPSVVFQITGLNWATSRIISLYWSSF
jgi:hypothetical protein